MITERSCGGCTLCCKLLAIDEIQKPVNQWCMHCVVGQGCKIYDRRPQSCQDFECLWLQGLATLRTRPDSSHVVLFLPEDGGVVLGVMVDPAFPQAIDSDEVKASIHTWLRTSPDHVAVVMCGQRQEIRGTSRKAIARVERRIHFHKANPGGEFLL